MKKYIFFIFIFVSISLYAGWTRTYGGSSWDQSYSVQQTTDGGYIIAGYTLSYGAGSYDIYLIKTNANGDTSWTRTYGGYSDDYGWSVQQTADGGYIISGYTFTYGAGASDVYLIKTNASGDTSWTRTYGGINWDEGYSVRQTTDNGYIVAGITYSYGAGASDVYLIKTDTNGDTLWTRTYGGSDYDEGLSVRQTTDGGYIIAGNTQSSGNVYYDVYLIKTDANGDTSWTRTYGGSTDDYGWSVQQTTDGGYIIAGITRSYGAGNRDVYLIKTDTNGDTLWTRTYGGSSNDYGYSVRQTTDGGYIIAGFTRSYGAGNNDVYLIKTDANGDTTWTRTYGGSSDDEGWSVQQTTDGWYIVAGYTGSYGAGARDVYLIKISPPESFNLIYPDHNANINISNPQFIWNSTTDHIRQYDVYIDDTLRTSITDTCWDIDYDLSEDVHSWFVIATDSFSLSTPSDDTFSFEVDTTNPIAPSLITPIGGSVFSDTVIDFQWTEVTKITDLNNYQIINPSSERSEIRYILELDTTATFTPPIYADTLDTNGIELNLSEYDYYFWRVKAYDLAGNESPFSGVDSFGVDITAPVIESTTVIPDTTTIGPFNIDVRITDNRSLDSCLIFYRRSSDPDWISDTLSSTGGDWYSGTIPLAQVEDTVRYYIFASDISIPANESTDPAGAPGSYYSFIVNALGTEENITAIPRIYGIDYNSPAVRQMIFRLAIPEITDIRLKIYDLSGRLVSMPLSSQLTPGYHQVQFRPENKGVYFYSVESEHFNHSGKFIVVE